MSTSYAIKNRTLHLSIQSVYIICLCLILSSLVFPQTDRQLTREKNQKRIALVIGNGSYKSSPLKNPVNDADDMAAALRSVGFEVLLYKNIGQNEMKRAISAFGRKLRAERSTGLFYYAGHGVQVRGRNYLIPIGAKVDTEEDVEFEGVDVGRLLAQLRSAANDVNLIILDACRNNPFARSYRSAEKGLASIDAPSGTLIAYSTAPGSVASDGKGRNGLYTQELLKQIRTKGLSIENVFKRVRVAVRNLTRLKQTPWESSSLTGDFYFAGKGPLNASPSISSPDPRHEAILKLHKRWADLLKRGDSTLLIKETTKEINSQRQNGVTLRLRFAADDETTKLDIRKQNLKKVVRLLPDPKSAREFEALCYAETVLEDYDDAILDCDRAIDLLPNFALAHYSRGNVYYYKKEYSRAIAGFTRAIKIEPNFAEAISRRGTTYYLTNNYDKAVADHTRAIDLNPRSVRFLIRRSRSFNSRKDYDLSIADLNRAIKLEPGNLFTYRERAFLYYIYKKEYDLAIADYTQIIEINPQNARAYSDRASIYSLYKRQHDLAIADSIKAVALEPESSFYHSRLGSHYSSKGLYELAIASYSKAIQLDPKSQWSYISRGHTYRRNEKYDLAFADYTRAIELDPKNAMAFEMRGNIYKRKKQYALAIADYTRVIELRPRFAAFGYNRRGLAYMEDKEYDKAIADFTRAIGLRSNTAVYYSNRGFVYGAYKRQYDQAIADYTRAIELNPKSVGAYKDRAFLYRKRNKRGDKSRAKQDERIVKEISQ